MASSELDTAPHSKPERLSDVLHPDPPSAALLKQRASLAAYGNRNDASTSDLLPSVVLHDGTETFPTSKNMDASTGWKIYDNSKNDSVGSGDQNSLRLKVDNTPGQTHEAGIEKKVDLPPVTFTDHLPGEQPVHLHFSVRTTSPTAAPEQLNVALIESTYPYPQTLNEKVTAGSTWHDYDFDGVAPTGGAGQSLHFKLNGGDVELKDISVTPESDRAIGVNTQDLTPDGIEQNIDRNRKTNLKVTVLDSSGKPVPDADVHIKEKGQSFYFGTEVQGLDPADPSIDQTKYQGALMNLFTGATVTPYWPQTEKTIAETGKPGDPTAVDYSNFDRQINWLSSPEHNLPVKLTPVFWPHYTPGFVPQDPAAAEQLADQRTRAFMDHFSKFPDVKVAENNEVAAALNDTSPNGVTRWVQQEAVQQNDGGAGVVEHETEIEKSALKANNNNTMQIIYNDYIENGQETKLLDQLQKDGKLPDEIGIQMHMTQGEWPLARVEKIVNDLAKYGKPIYISEISVVSGDHRIGVDGKKIPENSWPSTAEGEKRQADYVDKLYSLLYSNPNVHGITWWDLGDKNSWQSAPRGLLRSDMSPKPAYNLLEQRIRHDWETDNNCRTDSKGSCDERVFAGDYEITVSDGHDPVTTRTVHINKTSSDSTDIEIQLE